MAEFKGYDLFDDVEDRVIRAWNRCNTIFNIRERHSQELAEEYVNQFNDVSKLQIFVMLETIKVDGYNKVRMMVQENVNELELA